MKRYIVTLTGHFMNTYEVAAKDEEEAVDLVVKGKGGTMIYDDMDIDDYEVKEEGI